MGQEAGPVRAAVGGESGSRRLLAAPLRRAVRGERVLGRRAGVDGGGRGAGVGVGGGVLQHHVEHLLAVQGVRALHAGGMEEHEAGRLRPGDLPRRRRLHHLQLRPAGELRRGTAFRRYRLI